MPLEASHYEQTGTGGRRRLRRAARHLVAALVAVLVLAPPALASGVTNSGDDLRDGWYPEESTLTPQLVSGGTFGQLWSASVEGSVYAQPLLANGTLIVATENNKVYGLDPSTGALRWPAPLNLGTPWRAADLSCGDLTPNIGVTATPVIDPSTNTAYMTHKTYASGSSGPARWYLDAIDISKGTEKAGFPVELSGKAQNAPAQTFDPTHQMQRPGLLLMNGVVYAGFGSHCDVSPWQGWVFGVSTAGQLRARWVSVASGIGAGIWQSGSGLMSDREGSLLVSTGNGGSPSTPAPGSLVPANLGESVIRLVVQSDGTLKPVDFFTPFDAEQLDKGDADFASGGVTALNDQYFGTTSVPHLAVAVGKNGWVYLLNRAELGGFKQGSGGADKVVQRIGPYGGVWSRPGVWPGDGGWVYIPTASGSNSASGTTGFLRVYQYGVSGTGQPTLSLQATSSDAFGFSSSAPVITSDGTTSGSALVWLVWAPNGTGVGAQLRAYDPIPVGGKPVLRWSAPVGTSSKFTMPGVGAGRIYVGNREGKVFGFGSPVTPTLSGHATSYPNTTIGQESEKAITLTANTGLTVEKITSSSAQFVVGKPTPALPAALGAGQTISVPVTFHPSESGLIGGSLTVETDHGTSTFSLSGNGQSATAQLQSTPTVVSFGGTSIGGHLSSTATFRNIGGAPLTVNGVKLPSAPFGATGVPEKGSKVEPGQSVTVTLSFDPTSEGNFSDQLVLETSAGNGTVGLAGSAGKPGVLSITSENNEFGAVAIGSTASRSFKLTNTGGTNINLTKSKPPSGGAFEATTSLPEGTTLTPGESLTETVTFTPTTPGPASGVWTINGDDTSGLHEVKFTGTGTVPAPPSGWVANGSATISSAGVIQLTPVATEKAGSAFFKTPLESGHLVVSYEQTIGGGSGADGQTVTFADASKVTAASALGEKGGGLGFSGIPGTAVAFDTFQNSVNPSNNFVGITNGPASKPDLLHWLATSSAIPGLRTATRHIKIEVLNGVVTVWVDGAKALSLAVTLPPKVLVGFTGGTGGVDDAHQAANVSVTGEPAEPAPAGLTITNAVNAPSGSPQAGTQMSFSGNCPSSFTAGPLAGGASATPTLTGAVSGASCSVSEAAPSGSGWKTTASVNGGPAVELTPSGGQLSVAAFALAAGANTVAFTNTYTPPAPPSLKITNSVAAPAGSPQATTQMTFSGSCPSSFTAGPLASGGSATPALTGAAVGSSCAVSEAAPTGTGWTTTASVNGGPAVALTPSGGQLTVPSFALASGVNTVAFANTFTPPNGSLIPDPSEGGWQLNGSAALEGKSLALTQAVSNEAGSAYWPQKMDSHNLQLEFEISIGGGTGADGLALVLADASKGATPKSLGASGGGLGFSGTPGIAIAYDTFKNAANPSSNFTGISNGPGAEPKLLHWLGTANLSTPLRNMTHKIKITTSGGAITGYFDGTKIGSLAVALPSSAYIGFTGGTGTQTDRHAIASLKVTKTA
jgi:iron transport multicopper oxidase